MLAQQSEISWTAVVVIMVVVGLLMVGSGWLVIWAARKAASGGFERNNGWVGLRTNATNSSDEAWIAGQQAAKRSTILGGRISLLTGVLPLIAGLLLGGTPERAIVIWSIGIGVGTVLFLAFVVYGAWLGQSAAQDVVVDLS